MPPSRCSYAGVSACLFGSLERRLRPSGPGWLFLATEPRSGGVHCVVSGLHYGDHVASRGGVLVLSGRRYRLKLTAGQAAMCEEFGNICRAVWNTGLDQRRQYRRRGVWMNYVPQAAELAEAKRDHAWLKAAPSHVLQQTLKDLDRACRDHGTFKVRKTSACSRTSWESPRSPGTTPLKRGSASTASMAARPAPPVDQRGKTAPRRLRSDGCRRSHGCRLR
ncbi:helix-turn-helix domain-containing protein [Streptomyces sp. NBC_00299]